MELLDISGALGMADEQAVSWDNPSFFFSFFFYYYYYYYYFIAQFHIQYRSSIESVKNMGSQQKGVH